MQSWLDLQLTGLFVPKPCRTLRLPLPLAITIRGGRDEVQVGQGFANQR